MGFTPREVDRMSLWEYMACLKGWTVSKGGKWRDEKRELQDHELREMGIEGF